MASGVHSVYPQLPPTYPQHTHSSSMNGSFPPPMGSFDAGQSVGATPAPTPPPPRPGSQQQMQYGAAPNGMMPPNGYAYANANMFDQPQYYQNGVKPQPQIYTAVYSNVSVFEMEVNGVAVMRRRADGWLNATQILKVAGVDKGKRTKVLEKEVQNGEHEKVQGGYGKYQGTWINYQRGREFCRAYGVEELLLPLLEYDMNADGGAQAPMDTPTKEQAMAAQRKRMYGSDNRQSSQGGTFFKNMSSTAANAISALNRTRVDSPSRMDGRRSVGPRRPSQAQYGQDPLYAGSQQSVHSMHSQDSFGNNGVLSQNASFVDFPSAEEPPRKRVRPSPGNSFMNNSFDGAIDMSLQNGSPTEPNDSFFASQGQSFSAGQTMHFGLEPLPHPAGAAEERKRDMLMNLFLDNTTTEFDDHPAFLQLSGDEFEVPIDANCNTALHWAATLGRVTLVKKLLEKGFNQKRTNSGGETALVNACRARNNYDQCTFPQLLEHLGPSVEVRDGRGRTLLHHIAVSSAMKGRAAVGRYYLESLLEFVIKQGGSQNSASGSPMTLTRFMSEVVNAQDKVGDTALNLAARSSTKTIIDQLIEVGADPGIENRGGLAPIDFGVGNDGSSAHHRDHGVASFRSEATANGNSQSSFEEAQDALLTSIREILSQSETDFTAELKEKQEALDKTNAALKESGNSLAEERRKLEDLQLKVCEKDELQSKIKNLKRSISEMRGELQSKNQTVKKKVVVGEADKGLDFDGALETLSSLFPELDEGFDAATTDTAFLASDLDSGTVDLLANLESATVLSARVRAYKSHNATLETQAKQLKGKSAELEERYKKIVSLCTGATDSQVDKLLDSLVQAVVSEQKDGSVPSGEGDKVELNRVRDFLRMIKDGN